MRTLTTTALAVTLTGAGLVTVAGQEPASRLALNIMALSATTDASELRLLDAQVDALVRADALVLASQQPDVSLSGRVHETFQQYHAGVPVYGGGISRQLANTGLTVSIFGTIHQGIDLDMTPQLAQTEALAPPRTAGRRRPGNRRSANAGDLANPIRYLRPRLPRNNARLPHLLRRRSQRRDRACGERGRRAGRGGERRRHPK